MTNHLPALRERESLACIRDSLAMEIMAQMLGAGEAHLWGGVDTLYAEYLDITVAIDARGEVVMGPGDWRRATVQTRLEGISDGVR